MALENWFTQGKLLKHTATKEELTAIMGVVERNFQDAGIKGLSSARNIYFPIKQHLKRLLRLSNAADIGLSRWDIIILYGSV